MIIFPMAGLSRRFAENGYDLPKYMLPLWGGFVFDFAVASFESEFQRQPFLFIYRETGGVRDFLESRVKALGIAYPRFAVLDKPTAGQAETVELGLKVAEVPDETPLAIFNIDTFRNPQASPFPLPEKLSGWLEVFRGEGSNWSFVSPSQTEYGIAKETAEKVAISDLCSTGFYYFSSASMFYRALAKEREKPNASELYIAPIYNHLISDGGRVGYGLLKQHDLLLCGVPDEYEALLMSEYPWA